MILVSKFTFHYVSISTNYTSYFTFESSTFTFHYVSISTQYMSYRPKWVSHLHSTMYLFQLSCKKCCACILLIYIPLCIYFNPKRKAFREKVSLRFTFHYVSISTRGIVLIWLMISTFTFHYVSISTERK